MSVTKLVTDVERSFGESQKERDARVKRLWSRLDPSGKGELDLKGLQKGFRRIDHREQLPQAIYTVSTCPACRHQRAEASLLTTWPCPKHLALKNADHLLKQIMTEVDTNRDGKIQYEGNYFVNLWGVVSPTPREELPCKDSKNIKG